MQTVLELYVKGGKELIHGEGMWELSALGNEVKISK